MNSHAGVSGKGRGVNLLVDPDLVPPTGLVLTASGLSSASNLQIGGKAAGLLAMSEDGVSVPAFFVIASAAFRRQLRIPEAATAMGELMIDLGEGGDVSGSSAAKRLRSAVESQPSEPDLISGIHTALGALGPSPWAVRSSMVGEDSASHSYAGQLDSFVHLTDRDEVVESLARCWGSAFSSHALAYGARAGLLPSQIQLAVIVQRMVPAEISGVLFTVNPLSKRRDEQLLTAAFGLGEGIVDGLCDTDEYVWSPEDGERARAIAEKDAKVVPSAQGAGTEVVTVEPSRRLEPALTPQQVEEVCRAGIAVAERSGQPMDVEWSYAGGRLYLLQARPITSLGVQPEASGVVRVFDNSNVQESYNGVTTPLTFSFASRAYTTVFRQFARTLGVSDEDMLGFEPSARTLIGMIHGRIYYNLASWLDLVSLFPNSEGKREDLETVMWHTEIEPAERKRESRRERLGRLFKTGRVGLKLLLRFLALEGEIARFVREFDRVYDSVDRENLHEANLGELHELSLRLHAELLDRWEAPNINDWRVMATCGRLRRLLVRVHPEDKVEVRFADLLGGIEGIESVEPTRVLVGIATDARRDPLIVAALEEGAPRAALKRLRHLAPDLADRVDAYLERYGDRSIGELKLESVSLREDPGFVVEALRNYLTRPDLTPESLIEAERERYVAGLADTGARLGPIGRLRLRRLTRSARRAVKQRERLRLLRTLAFGIARDAYRVLGVRLCEAGVLEAPDDVLYLTVDELDAFMEGRSASAELGPIAKARRAEYDRYREEEMTPNRIRTVGSPYVDYRPEAVAVAEAEAAAGTLYGMGCCGGVAEAPVRVILSADEELSVSGRVLCTVRTDPGWTPLFPTAAAIVVERGSQLSHSAVVAREFGIPTVVGVADATRILRDGKLVRVDGDLGTVRPLEREPGDEGATG
ncbi:MAG: PEP/pyruvate-binding domain-containing protein [Solirubrobacterales bacterium]